MSEHDSDPFTPPVSGLLAGKRGLIFGVANDKSLAWAIARAAHAAGASLAFNYAVERLARRVEPLAASLDARFAGLCDITDDAQLDAFFDQAVEALGGLDFVVHSVARANRDALKAPFSDADRTDMLEALDVSALSLVSLSRRARAHLGPGGSLLTLSYIGAARAVPGYHMMGVAKAALEASVRYLAAELGPAGVRVNALRAGPVRTLSASGVPGFRAKAAMAAQVAPLGRGITADEVGRAGLFLLSDLASGVTGEVLHVDGGFHITGRLAPDKEL